MSISPFYQSGPGGFYDVRNGSGPYAIGKNGIPVLVGADEGFLSGKQFRTFKEIDLAAGTTLVIRAIVPLDILLTVIDLDIEDGEIRLGTYVGGTPGGTFDASLPSLPANTMTTRPAPAYVSQVQLASGGTHTGGTELDVIRLKSANTTGSVTTVGSTPVNVRGVGPGTYYFRMLNSGAGTVRGVFRARWEEKV